MIHGFPSRVHRDVIWPENNLTRMPENPTVSALLIREILPVIKFQELEVVNGDPPENCAVCLYEFEGEEEIRWLRNCKHIFHRACLDPWMDQDQRTCPLCRTPFVPDEMQEEFNQRLWAATGAADLYTEYTSVPGL
ncbi:Ubiquitin-protein ligase E3 [Melia azedarach]|uniref:Ubiquitin-protein ligase E3 n=1 Tax=Melia azedarach TaxID=155640 RepID=A0ACC1YYJ2_MELAZ|nr:Ubiquitin-protein ligase E3 [Melia azedarach]